MFVLCFSTINLILEIYSFCFMYISCKQPESYFIQYVQCLCILTVTHPVSSDVELWLSHIH